MLLLRTWESGNLTIVDGLANVPLSMLAGGTTNTYRFELTIFDHEGNDLYRDSWERTLSERAAAYVGSGSSTLLESFRFGLQPGEYEIEARAYPTDAPDLGTRIRLPLVAFSETPEASDLILANRIEPIAEEGGGGGWSITRGGIGIAAAARTAVLPEEPTLYYYLELYGSRGTDTVTVAAAIHRAGREVFRIADSPTEVRPESSAITGHLELAGLPPGEYEFHLLIGDGEVAVERSADFSMLSPSAGVAVAAGADSEEGRYIASLSDAELEATLGGVAVLISDTERRLFEALPPDGRRAYLTEFFRKHDPEPASSGNTFLEEYLERIGTIHARYDENVGTEERRPWATARGSLYLRLGEPQNRVVNYSPHDLGTPTSVLGSGGFAGEPPYEIWQYQDTGFVYLFVQQDRFGAWRMVYSSDPYVQSLADWYRRVGPSALNDLMTNFGITARSGLDQQ